MYEWLIRKCGRAVAWLIIVAVGLGLLFGGFQLVRGFFTANLKTENRLNRGLGSAAMESGGDAVSTVSNRASKEASELDNVQETRHEIDRQTDAGGVTRAGRSGLCHGRPDRRGCGPVQRAAPD